jgi:predicted dienelactone hydrolase
VRVLEVAAVCLLTADALLLLWKGHGGRLFRLILIAAILVLLLHATIEGPHWQMAPAYAAALLLMGICWLRRDAWARAVAAVTLILAATAIIFCHVLPMFTLPAPDGSFDVGTRVFYLTDQSRAEAAASDGSRRELAVQAWYPANCETGHARLLHFLLPYRGLAPYRRSKETTLRSSYQRFVWTNSCEDGPVASGKFPVLLFNSGIEGRRTQSTFLMEELASHGYVVLGIDHPYATGPVELANGKVINMLPNPIEHPGTIGFDRAYSILDGVIVEQAVDTLFVLNEVEGWNRDPSSPFYQRLETDKVGTLGHSLGGSVAVETAVRDSRIRAVFDMSGPLFATARQQGIEAPFFFMTEYFPLLDARQQALLNPDDRVEAQMDVADMKVMNIMLARHGGYYAQLPTGNHASFTDKPLYSPYVRLGGGDQAEAARLHAIMRSYAVAFFDATLKSKPSELLEQRPSPFPGVDFKRYTPNE